MKQKKIRGYCWCWIAGAVLCLSTSLSAQDLTVNQLPNPEFRGSNGGLAGDPTGEVPTQWRTFAVGGAMAESRIVPLAAGELFSDSPAVNAVELTISDFGTPGTSDVGFDTSPNRFTLNPNVNYGATVYLRSNNADNSPQTVNMGLPVFDATGAFTGNAGGASFNVTSSWTLYEMPPVQATFAGASGELAFRLVEGAADNSIQIALPSVVGPSLENRVPNPEFSGSGGFAIENVNGNVPDLWRAFGLDADSASIELQTVPVLADELYPGSPATTAIRVSSQVGTSAGFDHEITQIPLTPAGRLVWGEVYMRADNADSSDQAVGFSMPIFDAGGFTGRSPGSLVVNVTPQWSFFAGFPFSGGEGETTNLSFRLTDSGSENAVLIAMPAINGLSDQVFSNGFEQ